MKKILTVSLFAMMAVSAANADIASTKYVNDIADTKENVANRLVTIPADSQGQAALTDAKYPSAKAVISYVDDALGTMDAGFGTQLDAKVNIEQGSENANKAVITDAAGNVKTGTITSGMITDKTIVNADISDTAAISASKISGLATVATSGSYTSLSDKPTIGNAELTIKRNNVSVGTFGANASTAKEINIEVPTGTLASKNTIADADVAANAAIAQSKIANLTTDLGKKEATANKLKASDKTTVVSDTNKDTLFPTVGRVQSMINDLDVTDTAVSNQYVSAVSEADGKITVTRADLPTVNNAELTIKRNNVSVGTFAANASVAKEINIEVPTGSLASKNTIADADVAANAAIAQSKISGLTTALSGKQATIADLDTIRSGATAGATALQKADIETGTNNGTIKVGDKNVAVKGLGSAAYTASSAYATSAQGTKADNALARTDIGVGANFTIPDECKAEKAVCSLVVRKGVAGWEKVTY